MIAESDFLAAMLSKFSGTPTEAVIRFEYAQTHEARVAAVQQAVDFACNKLSEHKNFMQKDGEDKLTIQVCDMVNSSGIEACHNASIGGNCDIVVKGKNGFLWLAEAKKHDKYSWLDKGFQQLATRYSTGNPGQDHGEVLIYCFVQDAKAMLARWKAELVSRNPNVFVSEEEGGNSLIFNSKHKHECSGLDFFIRHKAVSLYWKPKDT